MFGFFVLVALVRTEKLGRVSLVQQEQGGCGKAEWNPGPLTVLDWRGYEHTEEQPANLTESN